MLPDTVLLLEVDFPTLSNKKLESPVQVPGYLFILSSHLLFTSSHTYDYYMRKDTLRAEKNPNIVWQTAYTNRMM